MLLGLTSLNISDKDDLKRIQILKNLIPEEFEIKEPPTIDTKRKYREKFPTFISFEIPEVLRLLKILNIESVIVILSKNNISTIDKGITNKINVKSSY